MYLNTTKIPSPTGWPGLGTVVPLESPEYVGSFGSGHVLQTCSAFFLRPNFSGSCFPALCCWPLLLQYSMHIWVTSLDMHSSSWKLFKWEQKEGFPWSQSEHGSTLWCKFLQDGSRMMKPIKWTRKSVLAVLSGNLALLLCEVWLQFIYKGEYK